jgi:hypothetical protein
MNETHPPSDHAENSAVSYELSDVHYRDVLLFGAGLGLLIVFCAALIWLLLFHIYGPNAIAANSAPQPWKAANGQPPRQPTPPPFPDLGEPISGLDPKPRLEGEDLASPHREGKPLRTGTARQQAAEEEAYLDSLGWIDKEKGVVHMGIAEAMKKVAGKLPARQSEVQDEFLQAPSNSSSGREPRGGKP